MIVSPNESVQNQWKEHLIKAGVNPDKIYHYETKNRDKTQKKLKGNVFVLCDRYKLQAAMKLSFDELYLKKYRRPINLFPSVDEKLLNLLRNQYQASNAKARNLYITKGLTISEVIAKNLANRCLESTFRTVIIDEAHFLKVANMQCLFCTIQRAESNFHVISLERSYSLGYGSCLGGTSCGIRGSNVWHPIQ